MLPTTGDRHQLIGPVAQLFLEINDNQKRVPSSLRWDLVRLVKPDDDPYALASVEIIFQLSTEDTSPLFQRIDRTGEQSEIQLKQGSLAPEIRSMLIKKSPIQELSFDEQYRLLVQYLIAIRSLDPDGWKASTSPTASLGGAARTGRAARKDRRRGRSALTR